MKTNNYLIYLCLVLIFGCDSRPKVEFLYTDSPDLFNCQGADMDMVKEAVYIFEDYIAEHYAYISKRTPEGYYNYIKLLLDDRAPASEFFNDHLVEFKEYIKEEPGLWEERDGQMKLNYEHELVNCMINNIYDDDLRNTIDAMISSKTVKPEVLGPVLLRNHKEVSSDRALATYVIFETFYPKLFYMDSPDFVSNAEKLRDKSIITKSAIEPLEKKDSTN